MRWHDLRRIQAAASSAAQSPMPFELDTATNPHGRKRERRFGDHTGPESKMSAAGARACALLGTRSSSSPPRRHLAVHRQIGEGRVGCSDFGEDGDRDDAERGWHPVSRTRRYPYRQTRYEISAAIGKHDSLTPARSQNRRSPPNPLRPSRDIRQHVGKQLEEGGSREAL